MNADAILAKSIEELYKIFAIYPTPRWASEYFPQGEMPFTPPKYEVRLHSAPLNELSVDDLKEYAEEALNCWGDKAVFRHYLPRIFELYPQKIEFDSCPEMIYNKLRYAEWLSWPMVERDAVRNYLHALWERALLIEWPPVKTGADCDIDDWLCAVAQAEDDIEPYLHQWIQTPDLARAVSLARFIPSTSVIIPSSKQKNELGYDRSAFWNDREAQYEQVESWIKQKNVAEFLADAINRASGTSLEEIQQAHRAVSS